MPDFWIDSDSLITSSRGYYRFGLVPQFWDKLAELANADVIACPEIIFDLELSGIEDQLLDWATTHKTALFKSASEAIQATHQQVVDSVNSNPRFAQHHKAAFCSKADTWLIAYAKVLGGRIVTFEVSAPDSQRPKIPDIAGEFGVECIKIYDMLTELNISL